MEKKKYYPQNKKKHYPKKHYPKKQNNHSNQVPSITKPFAHDNRIRYQKGHQNQMLNATRQTETITKDKRVIVTESVNIVDFNSDNFVYQFGGERLNKKTKLQ